MHPRGCALREPRAAGCGYGPVGSSPVANPLLKLRHRIRQMEDRVLKRGDLLDCPALEDLSGVKVTGILLPDIAHVIEKLVDQLLGLGINLAGSGFWGGSFHGAGST